MVHTNDTTTAESPAPLADDMSPVRFVASGRYFAIGLMAGTAFLGGLAEAVFLVAVTRSAFAITDGDAKVGIIASWFIGVNFALLLALSLAIVRGALAVFANWQGMKLLSGVVADVRRRLADAFLASSWEVQAAQRSGSLQELLTNYSGTAGGVMGSLCQLVIAGANLVALIGLAVALDPAGAVVLVVSVSVLGLVLRPLRAVIRRRARDATAAGMEFAVSVNEVSDLGMELHVFHVQDEARRQIFGLIDEARGTGRRHGFVAGLTGPIYTSLAYLALVGALAVVAASTATSLTSLGAVMLVMLRSLSYGQSLQNSFVGIASSTPMLHAVQSQLRNFVDGRRDDGGQVVGSLGPVRADHVSFSYIEGQEVLQDVSFVIEPCEVVGIIGPSGGGKSTLVQLLLGLRDPDEGVVLAAGRDIRQFDRAEWARTVTFVPQTPHLMVGSIADNIRFMRHGITDAEVERAARLAHFHEEVEAFPEGYQRLVGAHGGYLSGGQQQRLCIARALVENPELLILDEPTSALDARSERLIRTTLETLKDRMAVVIIAHRLTTLEICDRIMVIQDGELRGFDAPAELERHNDFYIEALSLSGLRER